MNYEELYGNLKDTEKSLDSLAKAASKAAKEIARGTEKGELKSVDKAAAQLKTALEQQQALLDTLNETLGSFDRREYMSNGDFEQQLVEEAEKRGIDILKKGTGTYEMFPNKVTINPDGQEVVVDKKHYASLRPSAVAELIEAAQKKLRSGSFNEQRFLDELESGYDLLLLKKGKKSGSAAKLMDVYKMLVPMGRLRSAYDAQMFAFDLSRLYASGIRAAKDGRVMDLITAHNNNEGIRIVNENGAEEYFVQVTFHE